MTQRLTPDRALLVEQYKPLAIKLAQQHRNWESSDRGSLEDLVGTAFLELCESARRWNPELGSFPHYFRQRIKHAFYTEDTDSSQAVYMPDNAKTLLTKIRRAYAAGATSPSEASDVTGINITKVRQLWPYLQTGRTAYDPDFDLMSDSTVDEEAEENLERATVVAVIDQLAEPDRSIIRARFGFTTGAPMLTEEIASRLGLTAETVGAAEQRSVAFLREALAGM